MSMKTRRISQKMLERLEVKWERYANVKEELDIKGKSYWGPANFFYWRPSPEIILGNNYPEGTHLRSQVWEILWHFTPISCKAPNREKSWIITAYLTRKGRIYLTRHRKGESPLMLLGSRRVREVREKREEREKRESYKTTFVVYDDPYDPTPPSPETMKRVQKWYDEIEGIKKGRKGRRNHV
jgi:hypothetical protein